MKSRIIAFFWTFPVALQAGAEQDKVASDWLALVRADVVAGCSVSDPKVGGRLTTFNGFRTEHWFVETCRGIYEYNVSYFPPSEFRERASPYEVSRRPQPIRGAILEPEAAIEIALAAWNAIYGQDAIKSQSPYIATLQGNIWTVRGSLPLQFKGGVAVAEISKTDGALLRIGHGK